MKLRTRRPAPSLLAVAAVVALCVPACASSSDGEGRGAPPGSATTASSSDAEPTEADPYCDELQEIADELAANALDSSSGDAGIMVSLTMGFGALGDLRSYVSQLANVAPDEIATEYTVAEDFVAAATDISAAVTNPIGTLIGVAGQGFLASTSLARIDDYSEEHCGQRVFGFGGRAEPTTPGDGSVSWQVDLGCSRIMAVFVDSAVLRCGIADELRELDLATGEDLGPYLAADSLTTLADGTVVGALATEPTATQDAGESLFFIGSDGQPREPYDLRVVDPGDGLLGGGFSVHKVLSGGYYVDDDAVLETGDDVANGEIHIVALDGSSQLSLGDDTYVSDDEDVQYAVVGGVLLEFVQGETRALDPASGSVMWSLRPDDPDARFQVAEAHDNERDSGSAGHVDLGAAHLLSLVTDDGDESVVVDLRSGEILVHLEPIGTDSDPGEPQLALGAAVVQYLLTDQRTAFPYNGSEAAELEADDAAFHEDRTFISENGFLAELDDNSEVWSIEGVFGGDCDFALSSYGILAVCGIVTAMIPYVETP